MIAEDIAGSWLTNLSGTMDNPIKVKSFGDEQYCGCTGYPAESHVTIWLTVRSVILSAPTPQVFF